MAIEGFEKLKEDKKNKIYISAINEFAKYGYNDANTVRIAAESDIAKGSLFHYFGSKKGCFIYMLDISVDRVLANIKDKLQNIDINDLFECITLMLTTKLALYKEMPLEMSFIISAFSEKSEEIKEELSRISIKYTQENEKLRYDILIDALKTLNLRNDIPIDKIYSIIIGILDTFTMKILRQYKGDVSSFFNNPNQVINELKQYLDIIKYGILRA